jgi:thymidine phosphorylase
VTLALAAEALVLAGIVADAAAGRAMAEAKLADGSAANVFARMVAGLGGPRDIFTDRTALPRAPVVRPVAHARAGVVTAMDTRAIGLAVIGLGGGRTRADKAIDPRVGFSEFAGIGEAVDMSRPMCLVHAADRESADRAAEAVRAAVTVGDAVPAVANVVRERIA